MTGHSQPLLYPVSAAATSSCLSQLAGAHAGGDGLISALRSGGLEPERGGQAAELAHAVAKHDIKARAWLPHAASAVPQKARNPSIMCAVSGRACPRQGQAEQ